MEKKNISEMTNSEIREYLAVLENTFESQKAKIKKECEALVEIENEWNKVQTEINTRKVIF